MTIGKKKVVVVGAGPGGLTAAMIAHMLFHLVWYPFDRRYA